VFLNPKAQGERCVAKELARTAETAMEDGGDRTKSGSTRDDSTELTPGNPEDYPRPEESGGAYLAQPKAAPRAAADRKSRGTRRNFVYDHKEGEP